MTNKEEYNLFCKNVYVPVFSKAWWMDAICGENNWDVWIFKNNEDTIAALPFYIEKRGNYRYITKAPLTQNNGLIIKYPMGQNTLNKTKLEEKIIDSLNEYIELLGVDVYEQQFHYSFKNFLPFFWHDFTIIPRVTYVLDKNMGIDNIDNAFSSNYRNKNRKGFKYIKNFSSINPDVFFSEHEKIYLRQGLKCPFSKEMWMNLHNACSTNQSGEIVASIGENNEILSLAFVVWDEKSTYLLMGGEIPEYSSLQTFSCLVRELIIRSFERGLDFDFEGSVIKRINHSFREYGGEPKQYFRIRKVFNTEIIMSEANNTTKKLADSLVNRSL